MALPRAVRLRNRSLLALLLPRAQARPGISGGADRQAELRHGYGTGNSAARREAVGLRRYRSGTDRSRRTPHAEVDPCAPNLQSHGSLSCEIVHTGFTRGILVCYPGI